MQTVKLDVEDSKLDVVLTIIQNLKDNVVANYEVISDKKESKDFVNLSQKSFEKIWENKEDSKYDRFLKI
ncbi:MAG: hypothetical protein ACLFQJ_08785 [Campylobacterales bacterium]